MRLSKLLVQFFSEHVEKKQRRGLMCWTMPVEFSMNRETTRWLQRERLGGVKRAGACWFIKTSPCTRPAVQHTRLQEWGHHEWLSLCDNDCSTQRRGNGQRSPSPPATDKQGWMCVCGSVCTLRNYSGMWGYMPKKESESHSKEPYSPCPLKKYHSPIKRPGLTATLDGTNGSLVHWLNSVEECNWLDEMFFFLFLEMIFFLFVWQQERNLGAADDPWRCWKMTTLHTFAFF